MSDPGACPAPIVEPHRVRNRGLLIAMGFIVVSGSVYGAVEVLAWLRFGGSDGWLGFDGARTVAAAARVGADIYENRDFLYPPLGAILAVPAVLLPLGLAYGLAKIAGVAAFSAWIAQPQTPLVRALAVVGAALCVVVAEDVVLGNVNVYLTLALALVIWFDQRALAVILGVLLAAFAKPYLLPFVIWIARWKPWSAVQVLAGAAAATIVALLVVGPDSYLRWAGVLVEARRFMAPSHWNIGVSRFLPELALAIALAAVVVAVIGVVALGPRHGLRLAAVCSLLVSPYLGPALMAPLLIVAWSAMRPPAVDPVRADAWFRRQVRRGRRRVRDIDRVLQVPAQPGTDDPPG